MKINKKSLERQAKNALDELKIAKRRFKPKRETVLVRVQKKWHSPIKAAAKEKKKTVSKLHDEIYPFYLKNKSY